jgi:hypothetical protein
MKKMFILLFTLLFLSVTMFAQEAKTIKRNVPLQLEPPTLAMPSIDGDENPSLMNEIFVEPQVTSTRGQQIFFDGFETSTGGTTAAGGALPAGWTSIPATGGTAGRTRWGTSGGTVSGLNGTIPANSGSRFAYISWHATQHDAWMITPAFQLTAGTTYAIEFYTIMVGDVGYEELEVRIGNSNTVAGMTTLLWENKTYDIDDWTKISVLYTPTTSGNFYLGFYSTSWDELLTAIDDVSVAVANDNDLVISAFYPFTQIPISQTLLPTVTSKVVNAGILPQTNVVVSAHYNGGLLGASTPIPSLAPGATANQTIATANNAVLLGNNTLTHTVTQNEIDDDPETSTATQIIEGTKHTLAMDKFTSSFYNIGNSTPISLGNVYTITQETELNAVEARFSASSPTAFSISLYAMDGNVPAGTPIFTQAATKPTTAGWVTTLVPATTLAPGNYFLCINQLTNTNFTLNADMDPVTNGYLLIGTNFMDIKTGYGNAAIGAPWVRMLVELPMNDIRIVADSPLLPYSKLPITQAPGAYSALMSFPATLSARAFNFGLAPQTNIVFSATFNGEPMGTSTPPVATLTPNATSAVMTITPPVGTVYPTTPGTHNFVYTVTQTEPDANPTDNNITFPLEIGNMYAKDAVVVPNAGVGFTGSTGSFGNIFNIYQPTLIKQVELAFGKTGEPYTISLHRMTNATTIVAAAVFTTSEQTTITGYQTVNVPETLLEPGDYFLCINQTSTVNIGLSYDERSASERLRSKTLTGTALTSQAGFGAGVLRMIVMDELTCTATNPFDLEADPSYTSVVLSWEGDAEVYKITLNDGATNLNFYTTGNSFTATGLTHGTDYTWSVTAICYATDNPTTAGVPFTTLDCTVALPLFEDFSATLPTCWQNFRTAGTANGMAWQFVTAGTNPTATPQSGTHMAYMNSFSANYNAGTKINLVSRPINNISDGTIFKFWMYRDNSYVTASYATEGVNIYVSPTNSVADGELLMFIPRGTAFAPVAPANGWYEYYAPAPSGAFNYFIIEGVSAYGSNVFIDNVAIYDPHIITLTTGNSGGTAGAGGTINTVGVAPGIRDGFYPALPNSDKTFTFTADAGYLIDSVFIDGVYDATATTEASYTFEDITEAHSIHVKFIKTWVITATNLTPTFGTLEPTGANTYAYNAQPTFTFNPHSGYLVNEVKVNNVVVFSGFGGTPQITSYTFDYDLISDYTFTVEFAATHTVTVVNLTPAGGSVTPGGVVTYLTGETPTYTFEPHTGYHISAILLNGVAIPYTVNSEVTAPFDYTFNPINASHTLTVAFALNCYAINPNNVPQAGTITMSPAGCVTHGSNVTFIVSADCYQYQVRIGGVNQGTFNVGGINDYVFTHTMVANGPLPLIEVTTTLKQYNITATPAQGVDPMGYIHPAGVTTVSCGGAFTYEIFPDIGYRILAIYVDGIQVSGATSNRFYTVTDVLANKTIHVEFEEFPQYIIQFGPSAAQNAGGVVFSVEYPNDQYFIAADSGETYTFLIVPAEGFEIDQVFIDDIPNPTAAATGTYTFTNLNAHHSIYATFKSIMFTITATAHQNGNITPSGNVQVPYGANQIFHMIPDPGYVIGTIYVDGVLVTAVGDVYEFPNVQANHTIVVYFAKETYTITATAGPNGAINPEGEVTVNYGENKTFTFIPAIGYKVNQVLVNGIPNLAAVLNGFYTFTNVSQSHTIHVTFVKQTFTIISTHTLGGVVTPAGTITVEYGDHSPIYVFMPDSGYHVQTVLVDGLSSYQALDDGMYRFLDVTANHTIHVIFAPNNFTIFATASQGGVITPSGIVNIAAGASRYFRFDAFEGYDLVRVMIDGIDNTTAVQMGNYTFTNVLGNHTIAAHFEKKQYEVYLPILTGATAIPQPGYTTTVDHGATFKFRVELAEGYTQSNIIVRANNIILHPVAGVYSINNITIDQTVTINGVELNKYRVVARALAGGTIDPSGVYMLTHGDYKTFVVAPDKDYKVDKVLVNGEEVALVNSSYTIEDVDMDYTVEAYFRLNIDIIENEEPVINVFSFGKVVTIINEALVPVKWVEIMDMTGRVVWSGQAHGEKTEITLGVATGIYGVRITTESSTVSTTKVSIQ